jgi:hypothetical protein
MDTQTPDDKTLIAMLESKLEHKRAAMTALAREIAVFEDGLGKLRVGLGLGPSHPALPLAVQAPILAASVVPETPDIPPRTFRHLRLQEAIQRCLAMMGRLQRTGVITKALEAGGFQFRTEDHSKAVSQALARMWKDEKVTRTTENLWGLPKWGAVANPAPKTGSVAA